MTLYQPMESASFPVKEGQIMQSGADIIFYAVYHRDYDGPAAKPSLLSQARREYFTQGKTVSVKEENLDSGVKAVYRGKIGRHAFIWSVKRDGRVVQQAFRGKDGYELARFDERGETIEKAHFTMDLHWTGAAYYMKGRRDQLPAAVLSPTEEGLVLTEWNPDTGKYSRTVLVPCALRRGSAEQSLADARLGDPRIWAETSAGDFCYCTVEEAALRSALLERAKETVPEDISFQPEQTEEDEPDFAGFSYIANDAEPEEESESSFDLEGPHALETPPEPERPSISESSPDQPSSPQEDDYAADHELFCAGADAPQPAQWGTACPAPIGTKPGAPVPKEEELPLPALNSGLSQLLKLVQAELKAQAGTESVAQEEPLPADEPPEETRPPHAERYAVAAKNRHGIVVHAPELKSKSMLDGEAEPGWVQKPAAVPVKRIIISAEESYAYFGELLNGMREGSGRTEMANGHTAYEGGYHEDKRDGFGTYYYKSGKLCYVGNWKDNLRHGSGISFSSRDGSIFVGKWKDNVPTGSGTAFDAEGNLLYTGEWKDGKRDGYGTEYRNGAVLYTGEWRGDLRHGKGTLTLPNGTIITGLFENGKVQGLDEV